MIKTRMRARRRRGVIPPRPVGQRTQLAADGGRGAPVFLKPRSYVRIVSGAPTYDVCMNVGLRFVGRARLGCCSAGHTCENTVGSTFDDDFVVGQDDRADQAMEIRPSDSAVVGEESLPQLLLKARDRLGQIQVRWQRCHRCEPPRRWTISARRTLNRHGSTSRDQH